MTKPKPIVTDTYDFPPLIGKGYVYVDKTRLLRRMVSGVDGNFFFISRPRRHPVLRLDMSQVRASDIAGYRRVLCALLADLGRPYGIDLSGEDNPGRSLGRLIGAMTGRGVKVAVLIDEYDAPIGGLLGHPELYIFEFKCGKTVKAALKQCHVRNYVAPYAADKRRLIYVGINYSHKNGVVEVGTEPVNASHEPVNEPVSESGSRSVLKAIGRHPGRRRPFLLQEVRTSEATMKRILAQLIRQGRIEFRRAPKTGGYYVKGGGKDV